MMDKNKNWVSPYGDGNSAERIMDLLELHLPKL
jgi:hypothetical protein